MGQIRCGSRKQNSHEENVLYGLRGEETGSELCRLEDITESMYYHCGNEFKQAGQTRLVSDTKGQTRSVELKELRQGNEQFKHLAAEMRSPV